MAMQKYRIEYLVPNYSDGFKLATVELMPEVISYTDHIFVFRDENGHEHYYSTRQLVRAIPI